MEALSVVIIGCGNIAGGFDADSPPDMPFTHAGAYARDGRFRITACVDPDEGRRRQFMATWKIPQGYATTAQLRGNVLVPDIVSICSPTGCHMEGVSAALQLGAKLLFCEKPMAPDLAGSENVVAQCRDAGVPLAVNHTRRWDPDVALLRQRIRENHWGRLRTVTGIYNKGALNNGSHMLDLLHMLLGPMKVVSTGTPVYDHFEHDPTVPVWLETPGGVAVHLAAGHAEDYAVFELQLIFEKAMVTMEDGGMAWRERAAVPSKTFKGYRTLYEGARRSGAYPRAMLEAAGNIFRAVTVGEALESTGETALQAHRACNSIIEHAGLRAAIQRNGRAN
jgi:predicted dehydrogenase